MRAYLSHVLKNVAFVTKSNFLKTGHTESDRYVGTAANLKKIFPTIGRCRFLSFQRNVIKSWIKQFI